jgi:hypothetical protein
MSIALYFFAENVLRNFERMFSAEGSSLKDLFVSENIFKSYLQRVRDRILNRKEYYFSFGIPLALAIESILYSILTANSLPWQRESFGYTILTYYYVAYWAFVISLCLSCVWLVMGITIALFDLRKEKANLEIFGAINSFEKAVRNEKPPSLELVDFGLVDLSFGKLKDDLHPLGEFVFGLAIEIAVIGFIVSIPAMISYLQVGLVSDLIVYFAFCIFSGVLSLTVFTMAQIGLSEIWSSSKERTITVFEQLCDRIRSKFVRSMLTSPDSVSRKSRESIEKDVSFVRSMIEDLRDRRATKFDAYTLAKVLFTVSLPFLTMIISRLLK